MTNTVLDVAFTKTTVVGASGGGGTRQCVPIVVVNNCVEKC